MSKWRRCYEPEPTYGIYGDRGQTFRTIYCQLKDGHSGPHMTTAWVWKKDAALIESLIKLVSAGELTNAQAIEMLREPRRR